MKLITAIVKPFKLDDVKDALKGAGVAGITVTEVRGFGRQGGTPRRTGAPSTRSTSCPRSRSRSSSTTPRSTRSSTPSSLPRTGKIGDGKIWVTSVDRLVRIRTGEEGADAIVGCQRGLHASTCVNSRCDRECGDGTNPMSTTCSVASR